jgi:hypothetical protein
MLSDYETLVAAAVRDDASKLSPDEISSAINQAVARYSKDRPRQKVEDIVSPGGNLLPLPVAWEADFSQLNSLEYPIGRVPPSILEAGSWAMYATPGGLMVQVAIGIVEAAAVRATFSIAHILSGAVDTVPVGDRESVSSYASAILLDQLASLYSNDQDSTIKADSVQHTSKAGEFARRAKVLRQRYFDDLGIDTKRNVAAGVVVNLDLVNSVGRDRLTHPRRFR